MTTLFSRIIAGEIPGRFIWSDDACVAFLTIEPLTPGHTLVVPRSPIDNWVDLDRDLNSHLFDVARLIGEGLRYAFDPARIGLMVQGFEVPHAHIHVWPANSPEEFNLAAADRSPDPEDLTNAAEQLRGALREFGYGEFVPPELSSPERP